MLQLIRSILGDSEDFTTIRLLFANRNEVDILCREDLEKFHEEAPHKFKYWYTLSNAPEGTEIFLEFFFIEYIPIVACIINFFNNCKLILFSCTQIGSLEKGISTQRC